MSPAILLLATLGGIYFLTQKKATGTPKTPDTPETPKIPPDLWEKITNTIKYENNISVFKNLQAQLEAYQPRTPEIEYALTILRAKISQLEGLPPVSPPVRPPVSPPVSPPTPPSTEPPGPLADLLARAIRDLTVQPNGTITGPVTATAIQQASSVAGQLEAAGFSVLANTLRSYIVLAYAYLPKQPDIAPKPTSVPPDIWTNVQNTIRFERDPAKLRILLGTLQDYKPPSPEINNAIEMLKVLIAQIESAVVVTDTINKIDDIIPKVDIPPGIPPIPPITPGTNQLAQAVVNDLFSVQNKYGVKESKGKENKKLVEEFQDSESIAKDSKVGPGTMLRLAKYISNLPLVMYWPTGATKKNVNGYRIALGLLAEGSDNPRKSELIESAKREKGQSGIIGPLAA